MKYKVKLFYPEILTDYETGLEVEHHEIGWSWSNGPAIQYDKCIMSISDTAGNQNFSVYGYSPLEEVKLLDIIIHLSLFKNYDYNDDDIFCFGNDEMSIKEVVDKMKVAIVSGEEDVD